MFPAGYLSEGTKKTLLLSTQLLVSSQHPKPKKKHLSRVVPLSNGLYMGLILTTYKSWDDPPSRCVSRLHFFHMRGLINGQGFLENCRNRGQNLDQILVMKTSEVSTRPKMIAGRNPTTTTTSSSSSSSSSSSLNHHHHRHHHHHH